jgi:hypothetical protein
MHRKLTHSPIAFAKFCIKIICADRKFYFNAELVQKLKKNWLRVSLRADMVESLSWSIMERVVGRDLGKKKVRAQSAIFWRETCWASLPSSNVSRKHLSMSLSWLISTHGTVNIWLRDLET